MSHRKMRNKRSRMPKLNAEASSKLRQMLSEASSVQILKAREIVRDARPIPYVRPRRPNKKAIQLADKTRQSKEES